MMSDRDNGPYGRRRFLTGAAALGATAFAGFPQTAAAEPAPEVKKIRLIHALPICLAPGYLAKELLHAEGFDEIEYVDIMANLSTPYVASGRVDMFVEAAPALVNVLDSNDSVVALGGIHSGCYELFGKAEVRTIRDLKGRSVSISVYGAPEHVFVSSMAAYVGLDPHKDINWMVGGSFEDAMRAFSEGRADAFLAFAPQPQELRAKKIGHVIVNTTFDRPWSQYFCCMLTGNKEFVRRNPVATKRAMRAFLKAVDICATQPERAARFMADKGYAPSYALALEILSELPYRRWRDANPEDTLRFHALRLHEAGIIKTSPQKLIAQGAEWRFFNELKLELKA